MKLGYVGVFLVPGVAPPVHVRRGLIEAARCRRPGRLAPGTAGRAGTDVDPWASGAAPRGLSPPTRGSRRDGIGHRLVHGSIPAHTGKPCTAGGRRPLATVYPRPHGEARRLNDSGAGQAGLSPPTRGSLGLPPAGLEHHGSIPAHTGKPGPRPRKVASSAVYPRPHGEARRDHSVEQGNQGLSPPTRGSRPTSAAPEASRGSIPAHTGKPETGP